jgi:hypothetical protein
MNSLWLGGGATSVLTGGGGIVHSPLAGTLVNGKPYASYMSGVGPSAKVTVGGVYNANGVITQPGITTMTTPGFTNRIWGFPFTTGMVIIDGQPSPTTTISQTGLDGRTPMGLGNISMVSGAIGSSSISGGHAELLTISMDLVSPKGAPSIGRVGFATLALLLVGVVFVAFRRR